MERQFTDVFVGNKDEFIEIIKNQEYPGYQSLLTDAIKIINAHACFDYGEAMDPDRITRVDYGDYQGTMVFVICADGYQPSTYWTTNVSYGSCSACDALQAAWDYSGQHNYEAIFTLTLHMIQGLKRLKEI